MSPHPPGLQSLPLRAQCPSEANKGWGLVPYACKKYSSLIIYALPLRHTFLLIYLQTALNMPTGSRPCAARASPACSAPGALQSPDRCSVPGPPLPCLVTGGMDRGAWARSWLLSSREVKGDGAVILPRVNDPAWSAPLSSGPSPTLVIGPSSQYGEYQGEPLPRPLHGERRGRSWTQGPAHRPERAPPTRACANRIPPSQGAAHRFRPRGLKRGPRSRSRLLWGKGRPLALGCPRRPPRSVELIPGKLVLLGSTWNQRPSRARDLYSHTLLPSPGLKLPPESLPRFLC